ncbi:MAG: GTP-binding protein [Candidatus Thorarchaeota archaeon]|nr:GTP-binding protein [Candidatus Thorarchaeota archaeon]
MIHNTFLIRISSKEILASTKYWPVDLPQNVIDEFVSTRENLRLKHDTVEELALIVSDHKFHATELVADTLLVFVTDKNEDESSIFEKVDDAKKKLKRVLSKSGLEKVIANYASLIEPSVTIRLKIALVGEGGVGKTTTLHLLLGDTPPLQYVPTIALNLETVENIRFGNYSLVLWDFAGQERFRKLWRFYFHGADVIFLVCDSSLRNVIISKDILKLIKRDAPKVPVFAMANKQDKPNAMKPEVVQKILGIPTYPMVAIDKERRDEMLGILMTAASQYVGVALPDLPASELMKFTDAATEEAIAETDSVEADVLDDDEEYETVIEEVLVDEDGQVIEDTDDYEIIEEVVEEIFEDEEEEEAELEEEEVKIEEEEAKLVEEEVKVEEEEIEIDVTEPEEIETVVSPEVEFSDIHTAHDEIEQIELAALDELSDSTDSAEVSIEKSEPTEFEITPEAVDEIVADSSGEVSIEVEGDEPITMVSDSDEIFSTSEESSGPEAVIVPNDVDVRMAKEIIFEALEGDDIISAEIDRVSREELNGALEAFSSDEALPTEDEDEEVAPEEIDAESLGELEAILGPLDKAVGDTGNEDDDENKESLPIDNDSLKELSDLLDFVESNDEEN